MVGLAGRERLVFWGFGIYPRRLGTFRTPRLHPICTLTARFATFGESSGMASSRGANSPTPSSAAVLDARL